jgi:hypothetical protein
VHIHSLPDNVMMCTRCVYGCLILICVCSRVSAAAHRIKLYAVMNKIFECQQFVVIVNKVRSAHASQLHTRTHHGRLTVTDMPLLVCSPVVSATASSIGGAHTTSVDYSSAS